VLSIGMIGAGLAVMRSLSAWWQGRHWRDRRSPV